MTDFVMTRICAECPWRKDVPVGKFPPERFEQLREGCQSGGLRKMFACHMSPEGGEKACAGMLKVVGPDVNMVRVMVIQGYIDLDQVKVDVELFESYDAMARANGCE